jgi:serine/threonine protein kinase/Tfp pilus assembly protein PilF
MTGPDLNPRWRSLDEIVEAFESAQAERGEAELADFLPPREHPQYLAVFCELVRVDLELRWGRGEPRSLADYRGLFPELLADPASERAIAFEEERLRRRAGSLAAREMPRSLPGFDAPPALPDVGTDFLGFHLEAELGRGAFGRVYLARQGELADRRVALKVSPDVGGESQALARLRHTNIVPIHSIHRGHRFQAVCMPYLGSCTLADVLSDLGRRETLPSSGAELLASLELRSTLHRADSSPGAFESAEPPRDPLESSGPHAQSPAEHTPFPQLERLRSFDYVDAVLWIGSRLADGLAHAHERGVLHRDLKPANVLLGEDGEPLLLDFNLAAEPSARLRSELGLVGGTLPYMAPEQLRAYRGAASVADGRADLYALGVILYELLTGRHPFPLHRGSGKGMLNRMIEDRLGQPPRLRHWNHTVSPSTEAIVRRCLEPDPAQRYQAAAELHEDLRRQLESRPLRYAPEPSPAERLRKWARRHPRLMSTTTLGLLAALILVVAGSGWIVRERRLALLEAREAARRLGEAREQADVLLGTRDADARQLHEGVALCGRMALRYGVVGPKRRDWDRGPLMTALSLEDQRRVRKDLGDLLYLWARRETWRAESVPADSRERTTFVTMVAQINQNAERCYGEKAVPRALIIQRAELARLAGREADAKRLRVRAEQVPLRDPQERLLLSSDRLDRGRFREALGFLRDASAHDPRSFPAWMLLGNVHASLGEFEDAVSCYSFGIALRPELAWPYMHRGTAALEGQDFRRALDDFDRVVKSRPDLTAAWINRALARLGLGDARGAVDDLTSALRDAEAPTRTYFILARARAALGDRKGAQADRAEGLRRLPSDELSWVVRGLAHLPNDPLGALANFDAALASNPRSRSALQNKASVLSETLGRTEEAVQVLDRAVGAYPALLPARGVLLARLGRRDAALGDAQAALRHAADADTLYQVAGIYALTSRQAPDDRREALRLLGAALRKKPAWLDVVPRDPDLEPIRQLPEFQTLIQAASVVYAADSPARTESRLQDQPH